MIISPNTPQQSKRRGPKHQFLLHFLKITRLPVHAPSSDVDGKLQSARRDAVKVTALFNGQQVVLGDFPIIVNKCVIDQKVTCQFTISKSGTQSKLHLYIDQACSSGLAGHVALDLQEFIRDDAADIYLKYPLYPNTSIDCRGPVLKIIIQDLGRSDAGATMAEDELLLLPHPGADKLNSRSICNSEDRSCWSHSVCSNSQVEVKSREERCHPNEANLLELEGALSDIGEKLKALMSTFKNRDSLQNGGSVVPDFDCQSSITSPLLSSLHTGTSVESCSEIYGDQCTDSDDVFETAFELGSAAYSLSNPKHLRTRSDISTLGLNMRSPQALGISRRVSTESWDSWYSKPSTLHGAHEDHAPDECFMCSSGYGLHSYEGLQASVSRTKSLSTRPSSLQLTDRLSASAELPALPETMQELHKESNETEAQVAKKGPGLLKSLFGAVVVAGVSFLGARSSSLSSGSKSRLEKAVSGNSAHDSRIGRSGRQRYSFRR